MQRVTVRFVELGELRGNGAARQNTAGISQHGGQRANARRDLGVGRGAGQFLERTDVAFQLRLDPTFQPHTQFGAAGGGQAV